MALIGHRGVHTDIQPTMMALLGLTDDYVPDGRVLSDVIDSSALRCTASPRGVAAIAWPRGASGPSGCVILRREPQPGREAHRGVPGVVPPG